MLVASLDKGRRERYEKMGRRFELIDYTSVFHIQDVAKTIGFYGRLQVRNLEIHLAWFIAVYFIEGNEVSDESRRQSLSLMRKHGWQLNTYTEKETIATKGRYQIWLRSFTCPECGEPVFSCLLCYPIVDQEPELPLKQPWCRKRSTDLMEAYRPYEVRTRGKAHFAKEASFDEVAALLSTHHVVALTGAGISRASGILTFSSAEGLETRLKIDNDRIFDDFFCSLFKEPGFVVSEVARFQASFLMAQPNPAHFALAELERKGILTYVITENGDRLHQKAGSKKVLEIWDIEGLEKHFLETQVGWEAIKNVDILLAIGVGWDEHGIIEYARDSKLKILAIGPERPNFLTEGDLYLYGKAEELLPKIVQILEE